MKVYEMIQELSKFDADMDVEINVIADDYNACVKIDKDCKSGEGVLADVSFAEYITDFEINECKPYIEKWIVRITAVME